jgi:hypothetical protein
VLAAEMARRYDVRPSQQEIDEARHDGESAAQTRDLLREEWLIQLILSKAQISERVATADELRELADQTG